MTDQVFKKGDRVRQKNRGFTGTIHHEHSTLKGLYILIWDHHKSERSRGQAWHYQLERLLNTE